MGVGALPDRFSRIPHGHRGNYSPGHTIPLEGLTVNYDDENTITTSISFAANGHEFRVDRTGNETVITLVQAGMTLGGIVLDQSETWQLRTALS